MSLDLQPTVDDSRTNATFEEMMWALSRPGIIRTVPTAGLAAMAESLLDTECTFTVDDDAALDAALQRSGSRAVAIRDADYVFMMLNTAEKVSALSDIKAGTLTYPDEGASLFVPAQLGFGQGLRLSGPGVKDNATIAVDGIDPSFWTFREKTIRYPLGFDVYLVDGSRA
jgi:alpha-D-ribose 1-methylphosphonate 5-triphosphate synthase subunit PhnH